MKTFLIVSAIIVILAIVLAIVSIICACKSTAEITLTHFTPNKEDLVAKACKLYDMRLDNELLCGLIPTYERYLEMKNAFRKDLLEWDYKGKIEDILVEDNNKEDNGRG